MIKEPWSAAQVPENVGYILKVEQGVIRVYKTAQDEHAKERKFFSFCIFKL